jgi:hypothetical protein
MAAAVLAGELNVQSAAIREMRERNCDERKIKCNKKNIFVNG